MIVYSPIITKRLQYILDYIFKERLGIEYRLIDKISLLSNNKETIINYSDSDIDNSFQILPEGILFEKDIRDSKPKVSQNGNMKVLFSNNISFDLFSACFWMLSRYEEYQPYVPDSHGRYSGNESCAVKNAFIKQPIVDIWISWLKSELLKRDKKIILKKENYEVMPTIDIDNPWCYKYKGIVRTLAGLIRDIVHLRFDLVKLRLKVLVGITPDPFYQFEWLSKIFEELNLSPIYFILVGKYAKYDKSVSTQKRAFKEFIYNLSKNNIVGIHPSYRSANNSKCMGEELRKFEKITNKTIKLSRQHYLKITLPEYYQMLISNNITDDYSMGYAKYAGFRAGTSRSFLFYDLQKEQPTNLRIHPFAFMDRTFMAYKGLTVEESYLLAKEIINNIYKVNGTFVSLWHNESTSNLFEWRGWKNLYPKILKMANSIHGN